MWGTLLEGSVAGRMEWLRQQRVCLYLVAVLAPVTAHASVAGGPSDGTVLSPVFITLSSLYKEDPHSTQLIDFLIQLHWTDSTLDLLHLFTSPPNSNLSRPVLEVRGADYEDGFVETEIALSGGRLELAGGWDRPLTAGTPLPGDHCLSAWVVGYRGGHPVASDCLKIRPTWMQDNRLTLEKMKINNIFVPGTHNSGCYKRGETLSYRDTADRYVITQDQSVWSQLVFGIRYLDLRIGYYSGKNQSIHSDKSFWINHDLIKVRPLVPVLEEIKRFIEKTKDEVILLDLHRFPAGFNGRPSRHDRLVELLEREFKEYAVPYSESLPTLGDIWRQQKRIIISYAHNILPKQVKWLWPGMRQLWGNKQSVERLEPFLMETMGAGDERGGLWAAMGQLTPGPLDPLLRPSGSLRSMAHAVNRQLTSWARSPAWSQHANVVAVDFFLGTDLVSTAIAANLARATHHSHYSLL